MGQDDAVKVYVRVRPFNKRERAGKGEDEYPMSIIYMHPENAKVDVLAEDGQIQDTFSFTKTFWSIPESQKQISSMAFADQDDVFQALGVPAVNNAMDGYHSCVFAYGQTGSGKTYSMLGAPDNPGVAPRLVDYLFEMLEKKQKKGWKYETHISFMEIYNEKVKDLLTQIKIDVKGKDKKKKSDAGHSPKGENEYQNLKVRQDKLIGVHVPGLMRLGEKEGYGTGDKVKQVMKFGMEHRAVAETKMNATSSRSHAIFQVCLTAKCVSKGIATYSHINIVDLAGSERVNMSGAQGATLIEATRINLSLTTLRRVIDALIHNSKAPKKNHQLPPYRDSMLTYILSESLGGNSNTCMLAAISPSEMNREDTMNTLRYAMKAKEIVNDVRKNVTKSEANMGHFAAELNALRAALKDEDPDYEEYTEMQETVEQRKREHEEAQRKRNEEQRKIEEQVREMQEDIERQKETEKEIKALEGIEDEKAKMDEEARLAEEAMREIEEKREQAEADKHRAEQLLRNEESEKRRLAAEKTRAIEQQAEIQRDIQMLNKKKFALAFQQAFGMKKAQHNFQQMENEINELNRQVLEMEGQYSKASVDFEREYALNCKMNADLHKINSECERLERDTSAKDRQKEANAMRKENEQLDSDNILLLETLSGLRVSAAGTQRSKALQVNRYTSKISETKRKHEQARTYNQRVKEVLVREQRELAEVQGELSGMTINKAQAVDYFNERRERKNQMLDANKNLRERNEALQLHLSTHLNELDADKRRVASLQRESEPLNDEMRFGGMILQLGYGRVTQNGKKQVSRPHGLVPTTSVSPRRTADMRAPMSGRSSY
eukprot:TRINITY_DN3387_c0_g6_i1.p1 TRINITY_DN3387_c0_g6~~TRINITY_DN3387_c0_g6_i1.p1  ORF type:complete len:835 (+),score=378.14 TRINITY_DN3387_c0_g6_i1:91-2595(+)